jgi:predicted alpha/beta superfamily hydrolase
MSSRKIIGLFIIANCLTIKALGQFITNEETYFSQNVKDSFALFISVPPAFDYRLSYQVVYYLDANLKSGKYLRSLIQQTSLTEKLANCVFIGIGHLGNYHILRRRDFILSKNPLTRHFGHINLFYLFLKDELIPTMQKRFLTQKNSIIGHSLSGFLVFYSLFQADELFDNYFALSPSLWVDNYSILEFDCLKNGFSKPQKLYFTAGSKEKWNKILQGNQKMNDFLIERNCPDLSFEYEIFSAKNHQTSAYQALKKILEYFL